MPPARVTEDRLAEIGRRIDRLDACAQVGTAHARTGIKRRVTILRKEEASAQAAIRAAAASVEEHVRQLDTRVDMAEQSAAADVAEHRSTFLDAVMAELRDWDMYLERLQVKAATTAGSEREQAERAISELRRHRIAFGERLGEAGSASGEAWREGRKHVQAARNELERAAAGLEVRFDRETKT